MKGNPKIAFTAEAVALMRTRENSDKFSKYFVSPQIQRRFKIASWFIPESYLKRIFKRRINLSRDLDKLIKEYSPEQVIELAAGYSPRGLLMTQKDPNLIYIETDFKEVINRKKQILKQIQSTENITLTKNHHLVGIDAVDADLYDSLHDIINRKKRTLVVAETLTSYLNPIQHDFLLKNIEGLLVKVKEGAYLSHEGINMLPGFFGKMLLFYRDKVAKTKSYHHFINSGEIEPYFLQRGAKKVRVLESEASNNILYLVTRK